MKGNIFAGVLEGLGKALSGYGASQIEQQNKEKLMGMKGTDQTSDIQNYNYYVQNANAAGQKPLSFGKFIENKYKLLGGRGGGGFDFGNIGNGGVVNVDE